MCVRDAWNNRFFSLLTLKVSLKILVGNPKLDFSVSLSFVTWRLCSEGWRWLMSETRGCPRTTEWLPDNEISAQRVRGWSGIWEIYIAVILHITHFLDVFVSGRKLKLRLHDFSGTMWFFQCELLESVWRLSILKNKYVCTPNGFCLCWRVEKVSLSQKKSKIFRAC